MEALQPSLLHTEPNVSAMKVHTDCHGIVHLISTAEQEDNRENIQCAAGKCGICSILACPPLVST